MSKFDPLYDALDKGKTVLGVGPMSENCINAVIEVSGYYGIPIILIASRRQIECESLGGGYVMTTQEFSEHVNGYASCFTYMERDHGGPHQGNNESYLNHLTAMEVALQSYKADINAGFDILHIDPSLKGRLLNGVISDVKVLYDSCERITHRERKDVTYEVGTEEHSEQMTDLHNFNFFVEQIKELDKVKFVVGNMGLCVEEMSNIGKFDVVQAKNLIDICNANNLYLKGHNVDYVPSSTLEKINEVGLHSINVAPELGVIETRCLFRKMTSSEAEKFIDVANKSGKYKKWLSSDIILKPEYLARICGHYVFNHPDIKEIREQKKMSFIKEELKDAIRSFLFHLGWKTQLQ